MKARLLFEAFLCFCFAVSVPAKEANWTGNYTDKKYLNGQAVFQLNILQEGETITVDFDAVYNDGHGCAPQGNGSARATDKNTLQFTFTDSANNAGTGTIKRAGDGVIISINPTRVADRRCLVFYADNIRLGPAHQRQQRGRGFCAPNRRQRRLANQTPRATHRSRGRYAQRCSRSIVPALRRDPS